MRPFGFSGGPIFASPVLVLADGPVTTQSSDRAIIEPSAAMASTGTDSGSAGAPDSAVDLAEGCLAPGGRLYFELGEETSDGVAALCNRLGDVTQLKDLAGIPRVVRVLR